MGRELKRVALDFVWPLHKVWKGFINPHYGECHDCETCKGSGYSPEAEMLKDLWYGNLPFHPAMNGSKPFLPTHPKIIAWASRNGGADMWGFDTECKRLADKCLNNHWCHHLDQGDVDALIEGERLVDFTHTWNRADGWKPISPAPEITAAQVNEWSMFGMGHDSINCWVCVCARCKRHGWPETCADCGGDGSKWSSPEAKKIAEDWQEEEPPVGDGYQIWETVSEGSPVSPVFAAPEELADWMVYPGNDTSVTEGTTRDQWIAFIRGPGWAPSMIGNGNGLRPGVQAVGDLTND